jgi:hypothetical protein
MRESTAIAFPAAAFLALFCRPQKSARLDSVEF